MAFCMRCAKLVEPIEGFECPVCQSSLRQTSVVKPKTPPVVEIPVVEPPVTGKVEPKKV